MCSSNNTCSVLTRTGHHVMLYTNNESPYFQPAEQRLQRNKSTRIRKGSKLHDWPEGIHRCTGPLLRPLAIHMKPMQNLLCIERSNLRTECCVPGSHFPLCSSSHHYLQCNVGWKHMRYLHYKRFSFNHQSCIECNGGKRGWEGNQ